MPRATWFCVDIECNGPVPHLYDMVSVGAVCVVEDQDDWTIGASYYAELRPQAPRFDPGAAAIHGLSLEHLRAHGQPRRDVLMALTTWVEAHTLPGSKPVFVGHNAPFDWSFVNYSYHAEDLNNPFGYKALDTKALASGVLGLHWLDSNKERLESILALPPQDHDRVHRADYDASYQALILMALLRRSACAGSSA